MKHFSIVHSVSHNTCINTWHLLYQLSHEGRTKLKNAIHRGNKRPSSSDKSQIVYVRFYVQCFTIGYDCWWTATGCNHCTCELVSRIHSHEKKFTHTHTLTHAIKWIIVHKNDAMLWFFELIVVGHFSWYLSESLLVLFISFQWKFIFAIASLVQISIYYITNFISCINNAKWYEWLEWKDKFYKRKIESQTQMNFTTSNQMEILFGTKIFARFCWDQPNWLDLSHSLLLSMSYII